MSESLGSSALEKLNKLVEDIYYFRDHYFENNDISEAANKAAKVKKKQIEVLKVCLRCLNVIFLFRFIAGYN